MKRTQLERQVAALNQKATQPSRAGVSHFIRSAEKFLTEERYSAAMDELILAQQVDPDNQYIRAIMERVTSLQVMKDSRESGRPLGVKLTKPPAEEHASLSDVEQAVRQLTDTARALTIKGQHENAFNTLMRAYLLDPVNPLVLSAEKTVLPAWETLRKQRAAVKPVSGAQPAPPERKDPSQRLQEIMDKKEHERQERERALWREASNLPKIFEQTHPADPHKASTSSPDEPGDETGFFSKFRRRNPLP
jgi:hypothetical protein